MEMLLYRIIYFSENHLDYGSGGVDRQLRSILQQSQRNNERDGITGALIFDDLWFIQALEGDRETVWRTFDRIREDQRHHGLTVVDARSVENRQFSRWSMALITRNKDTREILDAFGPSGRMDVRNMRLDDFLSAFRSSTETLT
jgi:hypothetical protein